MKNTSFASLKLRVHLETFNKQPTIENGLNLHTEIEILKDSNFQLIQDSFLSRLLVILDALE